MIVAWGLFIFCLIMIISGFLGMMDKKYDTNYYGGVFMIFSILALFPAQYIWG